MNNSRSRKGIVLGLIGIFINILLSSIKIFIGLVVGSISILLDGINNLIDVFTAGATSIGFSIMTRSKDPKYINGYGRIEYVISFIVTLVLIVVGLSFVWSSIERIIMPQPILFSWIYFYVILITIAVKVILGEFYRRANKKMDSIVVEGLVIDSYQDALITTFALFAFFMSNYNLITIDALCGLIIAIVVIVNSARLLNKTYGKLMCTSDDASECNIIEQVLQEYDMIDHIDNLMINDFGYSNKVVAFDVIYTDDDGIDDIIIEIKEKLMKMMDVKIIIGKGRVNDYEEG